MGRRGNQADTTKERQRVNLDMKPSDLQRLDALKDKTGAGSRAAVFNKALRLYEWFIEESVDNKKKVFVGEDGGLIEVKVFGV